MSELEVINERLEELERRMTLLEDWKPEEADFDPFELPSEEARSRAVSREEVEQFGKLRG